MKGLVVLLSIACLLPNVPLDARAQEARSDSFTAAGPADSRLSSDQAGQREYLIGPEDLLVINVWKEPEFSRTVPVRPDGKISLPLVEDIQASGLTPIQLARAIETRLKRYITKPATTVIVQKSNSHHVYLMGQVARPGAYPLVPEMTVLQALATAGGFREFAGVKEIFVLRTVGGEGVKFRFNYKKVIRGKRPDQNILLRNGDTIVVP